MNTDAQTFFAMGGYASFIWPAFGITVVVLVALAFTSRRALKHREMTLASLQRQTTRGKHPQAERSQTENSLQGNRRRGA